MTLLSKCCGKEISKLSSMQNLCPACHKPCEVVEERNYPDSGYVRETQIEDGIIGLEMNSKGFMKEFGLGLEPIPPTESWQTTFLNAGTKETGMDLSIMIKHVSEILSQAEARHKELTQITTTGWDEEYEEWFVCDKCGCSLITEKSKYCPSCGRKIDKV